MTEKNFIIAGFGGQGVLLAGEVLANAFMLAEKHVTCTHHMVQKCVVEP